MEDESEQYELNISIEDLDFDSLGRVIINSKELKAYLRALPDAPTALTVNVLCPERNRDCPLDGPRGNQLCNCSYPMGERRCV